MLMLVLKQAAGDIVKRSQYYRVMKNNSTARVRVISGTIFTNFPFGKDVLGIER